MRQHKLLIVACVTVTFGLASIASNAGTTRSGSIGRGFTSRAQNYGASGHNLGGAHNINHTGSHGTINHTGNTSRDTNTFSHTGNTAFTSNTGKSVVHDSEGTTIARNTDGTKSVQHNGWVTTSDAGYHTGHLTANSSKVYHQGNTDVVRNGNALYHGNDLSVSTNVDGTKNMTNQSTFHSYKDYENQNIQNTHAGYVSIDHTNKVVEHSAITTVTLKNGSQVTNDVDSVATNVDGDKNITINRNVDSQ